MSYSHEERARARLTIRRLQGLAAEARTAAQRGIALPTDAETAIYGLTNTKDRDRQIEALHVVSEKLRNSHLAKLLPLARDDFNAFCEYVDPDEPPESRWHIFLTDLLQRVETEPGYERFVLNCPPGHAKPLAVDTRVLMGDGSWKRLGDIVVGDSVISHTGKIRRVSAVHEQGELEVLSLTTEQGRRILAAPDHSFMMQERHGKRQSPRMFREAGALRPGNLAVLVRAEALPNTSGKNLHEFELAAFLAASGGRTYHNDRTRTRVYRNVFLFSTEGFVASKMRGCLDELGIAHTHWLAKTDSVHFIRINTKSGDDLAGLYGLDLKAFERRIPEFVFRGGDAELRRYIETYIWLRADIPAKFKYPRMHITFKSALMAEDFQRLLARYGVPAYRDCGRRRGAQLILDAGDIEAYLAAGFQYTGYSQLRLNKARKTNPPVKPSHVDPIRCIEPGGRAQCRCLTVEDDHTFIAEGMVVHNSTYASRKFVAWRMGRRPRDKIIGGGHSQRFVENEFSKKIRTLVGSAAYRDVFPSIVIDSSTRAADQWAIAGTGGQYVAKGAGQAIHGFRANFACIDDPYAKIEEAESPTVRRNVETWFFGDVGSRLLPNAVVFLIMTRFHEDDLTGAVHKANERLAPANRYRIIEAPAICYDPDTDLMSRKLGEVLWNYYDLQYFQSYRATWSYQRFSLVFQQLTGATDESSIASKFRFYREAPHQTEEARRRAREEGKVDSATGRVLVDRREYFRRIVATVDCAAKKTERADYTVVQIWGETHDRKFYLLDQKRGKWEFPEMAREIDKLARYWEVDCILVEDKGQGTAYIQDRGASDFQPRKAPAPVVAIAVPSNQGKEFRFDEISPMIEEGVVYLPELAEWIDLFVQEVAQFPGGAHDDQVDAMTQFLRWVKTKRTRFGSKKVGSMG